MRMRLLRMDVPPADILSYHIMLSKIGLAVKRVSAPRERSKTSRQYFKKTMTGPEFGMRMRLLRMDVPPASTLC
jgi:hypothetical protein